MNRVILPFATALATWWLTAATPGPTATVPAPAGAHVYQAHCAVCHGADAHGDGPWADVLAYRPADLTRIAIRSHGEFPAARVRAIVDGRKPVKGRFPTGMPIWGDVLKNADNGYSEDAVRAQVTAVVDYLRTLQKASEDRQARQLR